jgi:hypothetical protein
MAHFSLSYKEDHPTAAHGAQTANFMGTGFGVLWSVLLLDEPTSLAMA